MSDDGVIVSHRLFVSGGDASELFEFAEAAFNEVALGVEMLIQRVFLGARGIVGYDGDRALVGDRLTEVVGVVGGVRHDRLGGQAFDQWPSLGRVAFWPAVRMKRTGQPKPRTAKWILVLRPPRERPMA